MLSVKDPSIYAETKGRISTVPSPSKMGQPLGQLYRLIHARGVEYQKALDEILHLN
jgi:hypothetical protein